MQARFTVRLYENIVDEEKGVYDKETGELNLNPTFSYSQMSAYVEPELLKAAKDWIVTSL